MKKILYILPILLLAACTVGPSPEEMAHRRALELERVKQQTLQIEMKAKAEAAKTPEQRAAEQQLELARTQAESVEYLAKSRKVHDTMEAVGFGLRVFEALSN